MKLFRFGAWELHPHRGSLLRSGKEVPLRRKALRLLSYLVSHRDRLVSRDELLGAIWPGVRVSDTTLASTLHEVRTALRRDTELEDPIHTAYGLGYRFVAEVEVLIQPAVEGLDPEVTALERRVTPGSSCFVGRRELLAEAEGWFADPARGSCRAFLVAGEAGIGKSRLLLELGRRAEARGFDVHRARCLDHVGAPPCWPWTEILRSTLSSAPDPLRPMWQRDFGAALALLPESNPVLHRDISPAAVFRIADAMARLLRVAARQQPIVLVFDDLHRADAPSATLLNHVVATLGRTPLLVLGALRDRELPADHPLVDLLAEIHDNGRLVSLEALDALEVGQLAASIAGRALRIEVAAVLRARTGGNPLFVAELARALAQAGALDDVDAAAHTTTSTIERPIGPQSTERTPSEEGARPLGQPPSSARARAAAGRPPPVPFRTT